MASGEAARPSARCTTATGALPPPPRGPWRPACSWKSVPCRGRGNGVLPPYSVALLRRRGLGSVTAGGNVACDDEHNVPQHSAPGHPAPECYSDRRVCRSTAGDCTSAPPLHSQRHRHLPSVSSRGGRGLAGRPRGLAVARARTWRQGQRVIYGLAFDWRLREGTGQNT